MLQPKNINRIIFILSLAGVFIAIYVLQSFLRQSSILCLNTGCELVRKHPASYILGIPVPAFGLMGYAFLVICSFLNTWKKDKRIWFTMLGISTFGICFVLWFTYTEIFIIRAFCTWCLISTGIMSIIFILTLIGFRTLQSHEKNSRH